MPQPFRLYNTLSRKVEDFVPIEAGKVRLYVCGMTVYDHCHVGHARAMVVFDAFTRYLRYRGWDVTFVRNFTDVDDKIIARALAKGEDALAFAQRFIDEFHVEMKALGLELPSHEPRVSESMDAILELIQTLVDRGHAYAAEGNVWFSVKTCADYGKLSHQRVDELKSADDVAGKADGADFALWKAAKPGEPAWPSPWGPGRPGWHIECSAMVCKHLGPTIDIHGGGLDLVFPHHENEVAQSECGVATPYVRYWMHNGLLTMASGQKMGKSLGNVITIHSALSDFPAEAIRLYYLHNQYRSPLPWSAEALPEALGMLSRLYEALEKAEAMEGSEDAERVAKELGEDAATVLALGRAFADKFHAAADQDFNTAQALGHLFELARAMNRFAAHKKAKKRGRPIVASALEAFALVRRALGLFKMSPADFHAEVKAKRLAALGLDRAEVEAKLSERSAARDAKDWARSDAIRDELGARKIEVLDRPEGVEWRVKHD
ncbi:MAG: cysteine--tRNA ligase [Deltaproteobacteria bacterium]|nr:cysteine--tRNA ligase [Deltaproteobacteria bacterium]